MPYRLSLAQSTLLAGLVQAPSADDPFRNAAAARSRQVAVLQSMVRNHEVTQGEATRALERPLPLVGGRVLPPEPGMDLSPGPAFVAWQMEAGFAIVLGAIGALVLFRKRHSGWWRLAPAVGTVAGLLFVARALRGD